MLPPWANLHIKRCGKWIWTGPYRPSCKCRKVLADWKQYLVGTFQDCLAASFAATLRTLVNFSTFFGRFKNMFLSQDWWGCFGVLIGNLNLDFWGWFFGCWMSPAPVKTMHFGHIHIRRHRRRGHWSSSAFWNWSRRLVCRRSNPFLGRRKDLCIFKLLLFFFCKCEKIRAKV